MRPLPLVQAARVGLISALAIFLFKSPLSKDENYSNMRVFRVGAATLEGTRVVNVLHRINLDDSCRPDSFIFAVRSLHGAQT